MIKITVDGKQLEVVEGKSLLLTCLDNGIYIPNLCFLETMANPPTSCRLCFVEVDGKDKPVTSCKVTPIEGMVVRTDTTAVRRLQQSALRLLLSVHEARCKDCPSNRKCELQQMARFLGVRLRPKRLEHIERVVRPPLYDPIFEFVPSRCVLCAKCVHICRRLNGYARLTFAKRGFDTVITSFGEHEEWKSKCSQCKACVEICPVSAILFKDEDKEQCSSSPPRA